MKKWLLCLILLLGGCKSGYTMKRNPESDVIKIGLVVSEKDKSLIEGLDLNVQFSYVCNLDCKKRFKDLEKEYVDGIILIGEDVNRLFESYENTNHIPTISVNKQNQLFALKKLYPEYTWQHVTSEIIDEKVDAYYIDAGIHVDIDKPFYQIDNPQSLCELTEDKAKFKDDLNNRIQHFIHSSNNDSTLYIEWTKK